MGGKNKFEILKELLAPHVGKLVPLDKLKILFLRNLGSSGATVINHLRFAVDSKLIIEEEHLQYRILEDNLAL